MVSYYSLF